MKNVINGLNLLLNIGLHLEKRLKQSKKQVIQARKIGFSYFALENIYNKVINKI